MPIDRALIRKKSTVYAQTLLEALPDDAARFAASGELEQVLTTTRGHLELRNTLTDHTLTPESRAAILREVFTGFREELLVVLSVVVERDDLGILGRINERYLELLEETLNAVILDVTTVVELDDGLRESIKKRFSSQFGKTVLLREHIDASLLGGIVISTHGSRIDASVQTQLASARKALVQKW
ncbi:MAG: ATP synthase F1 subunit delta [Coriobacteriia bacterium]|nr:ATP synthase F1 subunit delta [Coriobacteriia bacterium]